MHYHCEVWIPTNENVETLVEKAMAPYYEEENENGFWDWYAIGGRWKGAHVPGYEQKKDPDHQRPCTFCAGTGLRKDMGHWENQKKVFNDEWAEKMDGCNVCHGTGVEVTWPTQWKPHAKDVIPVSEIPKDFSPATLILPSGVLKSEEYIPDAPTLEEKFKPTPFSVEGVLRSKDITTGYLVTVDYHS